MRLGIITWRQRKSKPEWNHTKRYSLIMALMKIII